jgi:hypothetical protein
MTGPRSYNDPCGIARALDAVGERWALLIVRELLHGPKRFSDLRERFSVTVNQATIMITRGTARCPDTVIDTDPGTLRRLVFGDARLAGARVEIQGDRANARAFFKLFERPR